jgi:hypothetical protein
MTQLLTELIELIRTGNAAVENYRCVFQLEDDPCIYLYHVLDYVDFKPEKKMVSLSIYQMVK